MLDTFSWYFKYTVHVYWYKKCMALLPRGKSSLLYYPLLSSRTLREYHDRHLAFMMQDFPRSMTEVLSWRKDFSLDV